VSDRDFYITTTQILLTVVVCVHNTDTERKLSCMSVSTELHDSHWMDFHEVSHLRFVIKSLDKLFFLDKTGQHYGTLHQALHITRISCYDCSLCMK